MVGKAQTTSNSAEKIQTGAESVVEGKPGHELGRGDRPVVAEVGVINIGFDAGDELSKLVIVTDLAATNDAISIEWHEAGTRATCDIGDVGRRLSLRVHIIVAGEFKPGVDAPVESRPRKHDGAHRRRFPRQGEIPSTIPDRRKR